MVQVNTILEQRDWEIHCTVLYQCSRSHLRHVSSLMQAILGCWSQHLEIKVYAFLYEPLDATNQPVPYHES